MPYMHWCSVLMFLNSCWKLSKTDQPLFCPRKKAIKWLCVCEWPPFPHVSYKLETLLSLSLARLLHVALRCGCGLLWQLYCVVDLCVCCTHWWAVQNDCTDQGAICGGDSDALKEPCITWGPRISQGKGQFWRQCGLVIPSLQLCVININTIFTTVTGVQYSAVCSDGSSNRGRWRVRWEEFHQ